MPRSTCCCRRRELGPNLKFEDIIEQVAGVYPKIMLEGAMDAGAWSCGMVAGLIHDIPSCKELIDRIMSEAESIIRQRHWPASPRPDDRSRRGAQPHAVPMCCRAWRAKAAVASASRCVI